MAKQVDDPTVEVVDHEQERFYELKVDGANAGMLVYELAGARRVFTHTIIAEGFRGRGLSAVFVGKVLDGVRAKRETITNFCGVVDAFIVANPEYEVVIDRAHPGTWARHPH